MNQRKVVTKALVSIDTSLTLEAWQIKLIREHLNLVYIAGYEALPDDLDLAQKK